MAESFDHTKFYIFSDSISCLQAIKYHKSENPAILNILEKCHTLQLSKKIINFSWVPSHIDIRGNKNADIAARNALQLAVSNHIQLPHTDFKQPIESYLKKQWQAQWDQTAFNKLKSVKPALGETKLHNIFKQRDEIVLHRQIGHPYLTHAHLLKQENGPDCPSCQCLLTVQHILIDCPSYAAIRKKYYNAVSLFKLFESVPPVNIVNYLKEIKLYNAF